MSVRGPRGGRARGNGGGRGRGRGRGKTMIWEWEIYTPGPEVYEQLWHIRNEPATVTPFLPTESPIPHAKTRIKDRRQTEGDIQRIFYVVEITKLDARSGSTSGVEDKPPNSTEIAHVDLSRILEYVSPDELERYENEQFTIEAEAEAAAMRAEAEEVARRRLQKNARVPGPGTGKGSHMHNGLGLDEGRTRGRPRGRGRGRGRGSWRGRGALVLGSQLRNEDMREELVNVGSDLALHREEEDLQLMVAETDSEEDTDEMKTSPALARSAFVANSALPVSPVATHRRPSGIPIIPLRQFEDADEDTDLDLEDADARSMSSAAMQLRLEDERGPTTSASEEEKSDRNRHRSKRRRTESTASNQRIPLHQPQRAQPQPSFAPSIPKSTSASESKSEYDDSTPPVIVQQANGSNGHIHAPPANEEGEDEDEDEDVEECVVEAVLEHFKEAGKIFYLVKWQGYEDSHDWLPEEDLEGAADLIAEYNAKVSRKQKKMELR